MSDIIPAILPKDERDLIEKVSALPAEIELFHFDVLEKDIWTPVDKDFEAHLMVAEPEKIIDTWIDRGAKRIIVHKLSTEVEKARSKVEVGLGVEMHVIMEEVYGTITKVDFVQLMSIREIGEQGHPFDQRIFDRIKSVKAKFPKVVISIDGGVDANNYTKLIETGANRLVVGSHFNDVWNSLTKK